MKKRNHTPQGMKILFEDADVIVIEKAAGLLTQTPPRSREDSVESRLTDYVRKGQRKSSRRVYLVHRLDRETSGVMMVVKHEAVQTWFRANWSDLTTKTYLARVEGTLDADAGVFESYLKEDDRYFVASVADKAAGKFARTEWRKFVSGAEEQPVVRMGASVSTLVEVTLKTGRKNQIRVHFREAGHPVVGDAKYGHGRRGDTLCLHAWKLVFVHPRTHETLSFETELPRFARGGT